MISDYKIQTQEKMDKNLESFKDRLRKIKVISGEKIGTTISYYREGEK